MEQHKAAFSSLSLSCLTFVWVLLLLLLSVTEQLAP